MHVARGAGQSCWLGGQALPARNLHKHTLLHLRRLIPSQPLASISFSALRMRVRLRATTSRLQAAATASGAAACLSRLAAAAAAAPAAPSTTSGACTLDWRAAIFLCSATSAATGAFLSAGWWRALRAGEAP